MDSTHSPRRVRSKTVAGAMGLLVAGAAAGGIVAGTLSASAATSSATGGTGSSSTAGRPPAAQQFGSAPVRSDEKSLSSTLTTTLTKKALAAVPGGTVYRVESDAGDATYEAHMRKADDTQVTVKFDANGNVTKVESGMGQGDPAPAGGPPPGSDA